MGQRDGLRGRELRMLPLLLLGAIAVSLAAPAPECNISKAAIAGGNFTVNPETGQLEYSCPEGKYPHPGPTRTCLRSGRWRDERQKAECRAIECPRIQQFPHGEYYPRQKNYYVGNVVHFECSGGLHLYGSENRTCQKNGKWSGKTTICDDKGGHCPNPGIPIGTTKTGTSNRIESKVSYECQDGLKMFGSKQRTCLEDKTWSGTEPSCRAWYTYDTPEEVAAAFGSSLAESIESSDPNRIEEIGDRKLQIKTGGVMNIFIIMDASKSVGVKNFNYAKDIAISFITKVSSYDFTPRYSVLTYASYTKTIIILSDDDNTDPENVIEKISKFSYKEHEDKQGTNTRGALIEVLNQLSLELERDKKRFYSVSNIILLMTDGQHNMGGDPRKEVDRIRYALNITNNNDREKYLDIYVFGVGKDNSLEELNDIASKKDNERHVFLLEDIEKMKKSFDELIDETEAFEMCGLSKEPPDDQDTKTIREQFPWIAKITITRPDGQENCKGSIISKNFILTAAHCFHLDDPAHQVNVYLVDGMKTISRKVKDIHRHPNYNPEGKKDKNVPRSFDFDFALLELEEKLDFSSTIRPICLPCTSGASWALKRRGRVDTCNDHKDLLLTGDLVKSMFVTEEKTKDNFVQMDVTIKQGNMREGCLDDAKKVPEFKDIEDIRDLVTDNFLCTGGIDPTVDPQTCKGDSGGPLIVQYKKRFVQMGVISWGTIDSCQGLSRGQVPDMSRDFHADVLKANTWIKDVVQEDLIYLD